MKNILSKPYRRILEEFAWSNVLLAFDYDGTLAPIVARPDRAALRSQTRLLLGLLTKLYPVIVISGRSRLDTRRRLLGAGVLEFVGNHGMESRTSAGFRSPQLARWRPSLERAIARFSGVAIEDKTYSITVHYRRSREKKKARTAILTAAAALKDARIIVGKQVVNIVPCGAPHKGMALERERDRLRCDTAIYVGDDETDEDVFTLDQPGRLLGIRVGTKSTSAASYCIPGQTDIDELLAALIEHRLSVRARERAAR